MSRTPEATLCLCMIVKNEAQVIRRALESVSPHIDSWVICDTGSTDETPAIVADALRDVAGELHHVEWRNFGHNREAALALARGNADYTLILDADMTLNVKEPFKHQLTADSYLIRYEGELDYAQTMLVSNAHRWRYRGATHEYIESATASTWGFLPAVSLTHFLDGGCRGEKYERDLVLLIEGLKEEPGNLRYQFYLAQTYRDLHRWDGALHWYTKRVVGEGWHEERWYAMFQRAEMMERLDRPWPETLAAYLEAYDARPHRLEPLHAIARHYREHGQFRQGYTFSAVAAQGLSYPEEDTLFIDRRVYDYLLLFDFVICASACGRVSEAIAAANLLLGVGGVPEDIIKSTVHARNVANDLLHGLLDGAPDGSSGGSLDGDDGSGRVAVDSDLEANRLVVVVPFHNAGEHLDGCVASLASQDFENFEVLFIDDASTDRNREFLPPTTLNARLLRNDERRGTAYNVREAVVEHCRPDDIVVCVDGDDQLTRSDGLTIVNARYACHDCWVMYGQYEDSNGYYGVSAPFGSPRDFATLRKGWRTSHLRTFRAGLFHQIELQDPEWQCLKDAQGQWLRSAVDAAIMFPLLEMAGFSRVLFNSEVLYRYTADNPQSHHFRDRPGQLANFLQVCGKRPFAPVADYKHATMTTMV